MSEQYKEAGVDIGAGDRLVETIQTLAAKTNRPEVLAGIGGFAGLFELGKKYKNPVLVASTDGVGTKLKLAQQLGIYRGIGQDCVAMCVNDTACCGAEPLFFLDYLAAGKIDPAVLSEVVAGIAEACHTTGCALLGGETAEMPGVYKTEDFDVAGFVVGVVEKEKIIDGKTITAGDAVLGVTSSGFHSNGFSLVRKIVEDHQLDLNQIWPGTDKTLGELLLEPTKLYSNLVLDLARTGSLKGVAHITGGGLLENPPRILPESLRIKYQLNWPIPDVMRYFREKAGLKDEEFFTVFNGGIGLVLVVPKEDAAMMLQAIHSQNETGYLIGEVIQK